MRLFVMELSNQEVKPFRHSAKNTSYPLLSTVYFGGRGICFKEIKEPSEFEIRCPAVAFIAGDRYIFDRLADR